MSKSNEVTRQILKFLFSHSIFAWRNSVGGGPASYTAKDGTVRNRFIQFGKTGSSDIIAVLPPSGRFLGIEVKIGKDRLRPEQQGFIDNIQAMGGLVLVVTSYEDFLKQYGTRN